MRFLFRLLSLTALMALSACLAPGTHTAAPTGASAPDVPSEIASGGDTSGGSGLDAPPPPPPGDVTSNQPGAGGSMPSGPLAPPPLVPVNFLYKAEGTYCRFESDPSQVMIWGRLYRKLEAGQSESEPAECTDHCKGKDLKVSFLRDGDRVVQTFPLDDAPDFRFTVEIDNPIQFGLALIYQKTVAIIGQEPAPLGQGALVDVSALQPYLVDGVPAFCPDRVFMKGKYIKPSIKQIAP